MAESTKKTEVLAAAERRIQYELELAARMVARKKAAEEKATLEAAEKAVFLSEQAEIEQAILEREELERAEAEKAEALMLAEKMVKELEAAKTKDDRILAEEDSTLTDARRQLQAEDQRQASEQVEKDQSETAETAAINVPGATYEASASDVARLDVVEQRMEKFSKEQEDMKEKLSSHGDMLRLILQKLP